jgi:hypothetical protein
MHSCVCVQYGEHVSLADWFGGFCAVHQTQPHTEAAEADKAEAQLPKPRRGRGRTKKDPNQA